jgi:hypothetical protein
MKNKRQFIPRRPAVTVRDVVVVLFVLAVILCLLLPWIVRQRAEARRTTCQRRQMALGKAILQLEANVGHFQGYRNAQATDANGQEQPTGWVFPLLPYLRPPLDRGPPPAPDDVSPDDAKPDEQSVTLPAPPYLGVYEQYGPAGPDGTRGRKPSQFIAELICPDDPPADPAATPNWSSWIVNAGMPDSPPAPEFPSDWPANGVFLDLFTPGATGSAGGTSVAFIQQHDGVENTLLLSENVDSGLWTDHAEAQVGFVWVAGIHNGLPDPGDRLLRINQLAGQGDGSLRFARPSSRHRGGVNMVYASGAVQFLSEDIDYLVFARLMISDSHGAEIPGSDDPVPPPYRLAD